MAAIAWQFFDGCIIQNFNVCFCISAANSGHFFDPGVVLDQNIDGLTRSVLVIIRARSNIGTVCKLTNGCIVGNRNRSYLLIFADASTDADVAASIANDCIVCDRHISISAIAANADTVTGAINKVLVTIAAVPVNYGFYFRIFCNFDNGISAIAAADCSTAIISVGIVVSP